MDILKLAEKFLKLSGGFRTLYHISRHGPAKPVSKMPKREKEYLWFDEEGFDDAWPKNKDLRQRDVKKQPVKETGWSRPWLNELVESGVFLTSNPVSVAGRHGIFGNVHVYDVAESIIKESGGIHRFDGASEILIPENIWYKGLDLGLIKYKGSFSKDKLNDIARNVRW